MKNAIIRRRSTNIVLTFKLLFKIVFNVGVFGVCLAFRELKPDYSGTGSILCLLLHWLLVLPGHQEPWQWPCRIAKSLSSMSIDVNFVCHLNKTKKCSDKKINSAQLSQRFVKLWLNYMFHFNVSNENVFCMWANPSEQYIPVGSFTNMV